jgi:hypothetical protein
VVTTLLVFNASFYGAAGAWVLGTIVSTVVITIIGGRRRVLFTAFATIPPFGLVTYDNIRLRTSGEPLLDLLPTTAAGFGLFVALPLLIAFFVARFGRESRTT